VLLVLDLDQDSEVQEQDRDGSCVTSLLLTNSLPVSKLGPSGHIMASNMASVIIIYSELFIEAPFDISLSR